MLQTIEKFAAKHIRTRTKRSTAELALALCVSVSILTGCGNQFGVKQSKTIVTRNSTTSILAIGDSFLAWHRRSGRSIPEVIERSIGSKVTDRSVIGARFNYALPITGAMGLNISKQYISGNWNWVVLNGGGNDLWFGCGCIACAATIDKLIAPNALSGKIPQLVSRIRKNGAEVVFVGYLHSPSVFSIVDHCKDENLELERRLSLISETDGGFHFLKSSDIVTGGDRSFHWVDMIHPSTKATQIIGERVAEIISERRD